MSEKQNVENLLNEWYSAQPLNAALQRRFDHAFSVDFNYNSNHLEGNTLTYHRFSCIKVNPNFSD